MMLNRLNHIAIVVPDLNKAVENYKNAFNVNISKKIELPKHGVSTVFIEMSNINIELLEPLGQNSPIKNFLIKNPIGGMHHLCYEVENINDSVKSFLKKSYTILGEGIPRDGAHGKPVIFMHPKEFNGTLIELEAA